MMIRKVNGRIGAIKFEKNDYQTLSEVQSQLDLLLFDTSKEINKIKASVQTKFDRIQKVAEAKENIKKGVERMRNRNGEKSGRPRRYRQRKSSNEDSQKVAEAAE